MDGYNKYIGQIFDGRYKIENTVGVGGMAIVFEATDLENNQRVAVKMLKDSVASNPQAIKRFINESKAVAMLNHPNIVKIYDISVRNEHKFIVMEFLDGITLREYMKSKGPLDWRETIDFVDQILSALDHAHMKNIVHRDIKPQNIMLLEGGFVKVTDFGIAKIPKSETLTMADKAIGTVFYISPEQAKGSKKINCKSDIYSLGVMMYEMTTGKLPFVADTPVAVIYKHISTPPVPPTKYNPKIPLGMEQIILCAMEKDPENRFLSAAQMQRQLKRLLHDPSVVFVPKKAQQKVQPHTVPVTHSNPVNNTGAQRRSVNDVPNYPRNRRKESNGMPMWVAAFIFILFLALAISGIILIYNSLFDVSAAPEALFANAIDSFKVF